MRIHTKFVIILLTVCMLVSVLTTGASAAEIPDPSSNSSVSTDSLKEITPSTPITLNTGVSSESDPFYVPSGDSYWKIYVYNTSSYIIYVSITKDTPSGTQIVGSIAFPAGKGAAYYCNASNLLATGNYYFNISTSGNSNLSGTLFYKFASSYDSLTAGASAAVTPDPSSEVSASSDGGTKLQSVKPTESIALNTATASQQKGFSVSNNYGFWKIYVSNTSTSTISVEILKDSPYGTQVGDRMEIVAGDTMSFYCNASSPLADGSYYFSIFTGGSSNLCGTLYYKFASSYDSLTAGVSAVETSSVSSESSPPSDDLTKLQLPSQPYILNSSNGQQTINFTITSAEPHVKIWCSNTSSVNISITVHNPNGQQLVNFILQPNNSGAICPEALPAGGYQVVVITVDSSPLTGNMAIRTSDQPITN